MGSSSKGWAFDIEKLARKKSQETSQGMPDLKLTATQQVIDARVNGKVTEVMGHKIDSKKEDSDVNMVYILLEASRS